MLDSYPGRNPFTHRVWGRKLRRLGKFLTPKLFDREHYFLIEAYEDRVRGLKERAEGELL